MKPTTILLLLGLGALYFYTKNQGAQDENQNAGGGTPSGSGTAPDQQGDSRGNAPGSGGQIVADNTSSGNSSNENFVQDRVSGHY